MTQVNKAIQNDAGKPRLSNLWLVIFAAVALAGLICWGLQLTKGLQLTNLNGINMWGLYIIGFMIFTGVAAGSLFFAAIPYLFNLNGFKLYSKIAAYLGAVSSIVAASLFIIVDIGNPQRVWLFVTSGNFSSPMFWDFIILVSYMFISIIFTRHLILVSEGKKDEESVKPIAVVAFIAGLLVTATSFVFSFQVSRPMWNNPMQPFSFLVAALIAALAVMLILAFVLNRNRVTEISTALLTKMGKVAAALLLIQFILVVGEVLIGLYPGGGAEYETVKWLVTGEGALSFWLANVAMVAAIIIFTNKKLCQNRTSLLIGAIIAFIAVYLLKSNLLQTELFNPLLSYPGLALYDGITGPYIPSFLEIVLSLGIVSLGCLLLALGFRKLNLVE